MAGKVLTLKDLEYAVGREPMATSISNIFQEWDRYRSQWLSEKQEVINYVFATSTKTTTNSKLPWRNNITVPKLTQIRDNLHANYMANLFPNSRWLNWEAYDKSSAVRKKVSAIEYYVYNKLSRSNFRETVSLLVHDYIDFGNCFGMVEYVDETKGGTKPVGYTGAKLVRISPYDITFNPTAPDWYSSPKIIRSIVTLGELKKRIEAGGEEYLEGVWHKLIEGRKNFRATVDHKKNSQYQKDGFGGIAHYYQSEYVEILDFYGDYYDSNSMEIHENKIITIVDRCYVARNIDNPSWLGRPPIHHAGWRRRPDNLYAMGALDNLVGMQYQLDKLYNAKADILDQTICPFIVVKGNPITDLNNLQPFDRIYLGDDADIRFERSDASAINLNADIQAIENLMEDMAGAPRTAMGIRTPGEKTKFEVQKLDNASNRLFTNATAHFEATFVEPVTNDYLEIGRRNMTAAESIKMKSDKFALDVFKQVTPEDLNGNGKIVVTAARTIAERANRAQEFVQLFNLAERSQILAPHISSLDAITMIEELFNLRSGTLFQENAGVIGAMKVKQASVIAEQQMAQFANTPEPTFDQQKEAYAETNGINLDDEEVNGNPIQPAPVS